MSYVFSPVVSLSISLSATPVGATAASGGGDSHTVRNIVIGAVLAILTAAMAEIVKDSVVARRHGKENQAELIDKAQEVLSSLVQRTAILRWEVKLNDESAPAVEKRVTQIEGLAADVGYLKVLASKLNSQDARIILEGVIAPSLVASETEFDVSMNNLINLAEEAIRRLGDIRRST